MKAFIPALYMAGSSRRNTTVVALMVASFLARAAVPSTAAYDLTPLVGPNHKVVDTMVTVSNPDGAKIQRHTHYTQIGMGLNYFSDGQWHDSEDLIEASPQGAIAERGYYTVAFSKNVNQTGAIRITLPQRGILAAHPLALFYVDVATTNWVKLSVLKDSQGEIVSRNRVLYRDAFQDIIGDIEYVYTKGGLEAHAIIGEQLPSPAVFGLSNDTTMLEMVSEFVGPDPVVRPIPMRLPARVGVGQEDSRGLDYVDHFLDFGEFLIVPGTAFGSGVANGQETKQTLAVVVKDWISDNGRHFLVERVRYSEVVPVLALLPAVTRSRPEVQAGARDWPSAPPPHDVPAPMDATQKAIQRPGLVIDWTSRISASSISFDSGQTYELTDSPSFTGTVTFGSAYVKYDPGATLTVYGTVSGGGAYLTAKDDNSVGDPVGNGNPCGTYAANALLLQSSGTQTLSGMQIRYADIGVNVYATATLNLSLPNLRILSGNTGINLSPSSNPNVTINASSLYTCGVATPTSVWTGLSAPGATSCANTAPSLPVVWDETVSHNGIVMALSASDTETPNTLILTANSSNSAVVPNDPAHLNAVGCGRGWSVYILPAAGNLGATSLITLTVSDGSLQATRMFTVTVQDPPTISGIAARVTTVDTPTEMIGFTVHNPIGSDDDVNVTASFDPAIIQAATISGSGSGRLIQVTPQPGVAATTTIMLTAQVTGTGSAATIFTLTITPDSTDRDLFQFSLGKPGGGACGAMGCSGGSDGSLGPCELPDVTQFNRTVRLNDTCNGAAIGLGGTIFESIAEFEAPFGGSPNCLYTLSATLTADLRNDSSSGFVNTLADSAVVSGSTQLNLTSPETGPQSSCSMIHMSTNGTFQVPGGCTSTIYLGLFSLNYQVMYDGVTGSQATVSDLRIVDVQYTDSLACGPDGCVFGAALANNGSVDMRLKLGATQFGRYGASLNIYDTVPCASLSTPARLYAHRSAQDTDCVYASGTNQIRQMKVPSGLVDVCTISTNHYVLNFYPTNAILNGGEKVNGLYQVTTAPPMVAYDVCNPNANDCNTLCVTELRTGMPAVTNMFVYMPAAGSNPAEWQVFAANNLRCDRKQCVTNGASRTETQLVVNPSSGATARKQRRQYQTFNFGEALVQTTVDPDTAKLDSVYSYYTNVTDSGYGKLAQVTTTVGSWQIAQYDSQKRLATMFSGFGNQDPTTDGGLCRTVSYDYMPLAGSGDTGVYRPQLPRREIQSLLGHEVSRKYYVYTAGQKKEIVCTSPGAAWNDSNNLVTITRRVTSGFFKGELSSVQQPDGTVTTYQYATNATSKTTTVCAGQSDGTGTNVVDGTKTVTVVNATGELVSEQSYDIATGILLSQRIYGNYDSMQRPQVVTLLDGTTEQMVYSCCGLDHFIDRDGVTTYYTYDSLKRKSTESRNGIITLYTYDPAGQLIMTTRQGTDGTQMVLSQSAFDLAGRLIAETNAAQSVTTYAYTIDGLGQSVKTITYAAGTSDAATRIETYAKDGSLLKVTGTAVNPVRYEYGVEQDGGAGPFVLYKREIKLDVNGSDTVEWTKTYTDAAGRLYKTVYAAASGAPASQSYFNLLGQLYKQVDPDGVTTLYAYNLKGELQDTASDTNRNGVIDFSGLDRVTRTLRDISVNSSGYTVQRTRTLEFPNNNDGVTTVEVSRTEVAAGGSPSWSVSYGLSTRKDIAYNPGGGTRTETTRAPDGSSIVNYYVNGRLQGVTRYDSLGVQIGQTTYGYDAHGRMITATDARNGTTTYGYDNADRVFSVATPPPGTGQTAQTTLTYYDNMSRVWATVYSDGNDVISHYYLNGLLYQTSGSRVYPVRYTYDAQGRVKTMTTWTNAFIGAGSVTTWNYDPYRSWLTSKIDSSGHGPTYSYSTAGRLTYTTWARTGQFIGIAYDNLGLPASRSYPASGPASPTFGYDRRNRMTTVIQGGTTTSLYYNDAGLLLGQAQTGGTLNGYCLTNSYDAYLRKSYVAVRTPAATWCGASTYNYDNASRLSTVSFYNGATVTYGYVANSSLVGNITSRQSGATRLTVNSSYDYLNRLNSIAPTPSGAPGLGYSYGYNDVNQRVQTTLADGSMWLYEYDFWGQVTSGKRFWGDWTPVAGQQFQYSFNDIGSRTSTRAGGDANGGSLRSASYNANALNQYSSRTVPGALDVLGIANAGATVTVAGQAAYRKGEYFQSAVSLNNASAPVYQSVTTTAVNGGSNNSVPGYILLPAANEVYVHDLDGNLTSDGLWTYTWDAENRLISMESQVAVPSAARKKLVFEYDYLGRRIAKSLYTWNGSTYVLQNTTVFVYDGWNLIAEFGPTVRTYSWGSDLSGSMQGAGGVGGLIATTLNTGTTYFPVYDGNGNIGGWVSGYDGTVPARSEYGPFGEVIRATSSISPAIPIRWSTKYTDLETDLVYYGYRYYNPSTGRWLSRDPIGEEGGPNLYAFTQNQPVNAFDLLGMKCGCDSKAGCGNYTPGSNGCGPAGWKGKIIPNKPFGMVDFKTACDNHDKCYGTCGSDKKKCDDDFLGDMLGACLEHYGWNSVSPMPPDLKVKQQTCARLAQTYYTAVSKGGDQPYKDAQKEACRCHCGE